MGEAVWKVLGTGAAIGAGILAKKLATAGWKLGTGNEPPVNPEDPEVTWKEAIGWAVALRRDRRRGPAAGHPQGRRLLPQVRRPRRPRA